jgi:hypothetical protein
MLGHRVEPTWSKKLKVVQPFSLICHHGCILYSANGNTSMASLELQSPTRACREADRRMAPPEGAGGSFFVGAASAILALVVLILVSSRPVWTSPAMGQ